MSIAIRNFPVPANEDDRLAHLDELEVIQSPPEPQFDAIVALACRLFQVPIALVSLVGRTEQTFKAVQGLSVCKTEREVAFCNHPVASGELLVVENAAMDPRFRDNRLVSGAPGIRFYAGAPHSIKAGLVLGTLCVIDTKPRTMCDEDRAALVQMAGVVSSLIQQFRDARERDELSLRLQEQSRLLEKRARDLTRYKRLFDRGSTLIDVGAWEWDVKSGEVTWTDGMFDIHELPRGSQVCSKVGHGFYTTESLAELNRLFELSDRDCSGFTFEGEIMTAKGHRRWIRLTVDVECEDGQVVRRFGVKQDITVQKEMLDRLRYLAECDPLTSLSNRAALQQRLLEASTCTAEPIGSTLLLVDLDGFKQVNDTYGHEAGDACLKQVADRLRRAGSQAVLIARLGGDEFALLLDGSDQNSYYSCANRVLESMRVPVLLRGNSFQLSASVGIATTKTPGDQLLLLTQADMALYAAKAAGRNILQVFSPEMQRAAETRVETVQNISLALAKGELELHYQPKIRLSDNSLAGFEALLRWSRDDGTVVAAGAFSAALEDPELSRNIGIWVVEAALTQARSWHQLGIDFKHIAINLSASQFRDSGFAERLIAQIEFCGLRPEMIEAEITEGVFLDGEDGPVRQALDVLRGAGIRISLDDFGTGYASLTHLRNYPVDVIKIDRSFVRDFLTSDRDHAILQSTLFLARHLSLDVVAEGVEEADQCEFLRALGCKFVQGYLFSKALPASEAVKWCSGLVALSA